ncbi:MAG: hypothetical protein COB93_01200 [Sneathiella sp.]|nr:MAG: hypothetical protein COB93_01200 [Sneathiella sp.]
MGLIFRDMNKALSVKSCYSKGLFSSAIFVLIFLLSAAFFITDSPVADLQSALGYQVALTE